MFDKRDFNIISSERLWFTNIINDYYFYKLNFWLAEISSSRFVNLECSWYADTLLTNATNLDTKVFFSTYKMTSFTKNMEIIL